MGEFVARTSRRQLARMMLGTIVMFVVGLSMVGVFGASESPWTWVGWPVVAFAVVGFAGTVVRIVGVSDQMRIDASGIRWAQWSDTTIPWTAVKSAEVQSLAQQQFLCLSLADAAAYPSKRPASYLARLNRRTGFGDVALSLTGTDGKFDEMVAAVRQHAPVAT